MVWGVVTCLLLWAFAGQAFPKVNGAQGMSLQWVGALIAAAGLIAAGLCFMLFKIRLARKCAAISDLKALIAAQQSKES